MVKLILISHGSLAKAMLDTASRICAFDKESVLALSVSGKIDLQETADKVKKNASPKGTLVLTDTFGGTACNMAVCSLQECNNTQVLCGLNLSMLLCALNNREKLNARDLAKKVLEDGKKAVFNATERCQCC